jgi:hypothetical protein
MGKQKVLIMIILILVVLNINFVLSYTIDFKNLQNHSNNIVDLKKHYSSSPINLFSLDSINLKLYNKLYTYIGFYLWGSSINADLTGAYYNRMIRVTNINDKFRHTNFEGLGFDSLKTTSGNFNASISLFLNDTYYLDAGDIITISLYENGEVNGQFYLRFINNNQVQKDFKKITLTSGWNQTFNFSVSEYIIFDRLEIVKRIGADHHLYINNLSFSSFNSLSLNTLPNFNVSSDNYKVCVLNDDDYVTFNFTISAYDLENDTILYGTKFLTSKNINRTVNMYKEDCSILDFGIFCDKIPNIDIKNNLYNDGSFCDINFESNVDITKHNFIEFNPELQLFYEGTSKSSLYLMLNGICNGTKKGYSYRFNSPLDDLFYYTSFNHFTNGESVNISIWDSSRQNLILKFKIGANNNNFYIYDYNSTLLGNFSMVQPLEFSINNYQSSNMSYLYILNSEDIVFNITKNNNYLSSYLDIEVDGTVYQDKFIYSGISTPVLFDSNIPNNFTTNVKGISNLKIYVTDDKHSNDYKIKNIQFQIDSGEFCYDDDNILDNNNLEFKNPKGLTGIKLLIAQLLWALKIPYFLLVAFGLGYISQLVGTIAFIFIMFKKYHNSTDLDFDHALILSLLISTLFMLMNLFYTGIYVIIVLITMIKVGNLLFNKEGE